MYVRICIYILISEESLLILEDHITTLLKDFLIKKKEKSTAVAIDEGVEIVATNMKLRVKMRKIKSKYTLLTPSIQKDFVGSKQSITEREEVTVEGEKKTKKRKRESTREYSNIPFLQSMLLVNVSPLSPPE
jgi:hypothetical protein